MKTARVAVIGGGISGLTAAYRLRTLLGADAEITVIESAGRIGGKLRTIELAGVRYDVGAEAFLARRPELTALAEELGLGKEIVHPSKAAARIRAGGVLRPIPPRTVLGVPADPSTVDGVLSPDAVRAIAVEPALPPVRLDGDVTVDSLLHKRFGAEVVDRLVDPLLGGVYAGRADSLGLRATMPALAAAIDAGEGSVLRAAAATLPARPSTAPVFGALRGGYGVLIEALVRESGARIRCGLPVRSLARRADGWRLSIGSAPRPEYLDADAVLLAVPAPVAAKLLADVVPTASDAYRRIELASMAVIALAFDNSVMLPDSSGVLIASGERRGDGKSFTTKGFTYSSRKWTHLADDAGDAVLVRGSVGRYGEAATLQCSDDELISRVRADLAELTGITAEPIDAIVTRWGGGLPQYGVGHLDVVRAIEDAVAEVPGLAVAGAALHGVGVPACVGTATVAAQRIADVLTDNRGQRENG